MATTLVLLAGCATPWFQDPHLDLTYTRAAQTDSPDRNPVVVIPGLMGTSLIDRNTGEHLWGGFDGLSRDPRDVEILRSLALPFEAAPGRVTTEDSLAPDRVLERARVRLFGLPLDLEVYAGILQVLGAGGYRDENLGLAGAVDYGPGHYTCFQFPYDWRRDLVESAQRLKAFLDEKRSSVRSAYRAQYQQDRPDLKFDIVTHSMGGLVARYFLMYGDQDLPADGSLPELTWAGAEYVERVVLVGTPNGGSVIALRNLVNGLSLGPLQPFYPPALVGTYPSVYQLMPRNTHQPMVWVNSNQAVDDVYDPTLWQHLRWGLADPSQRDLIASLHPELDTSVALARARDLQERLLQRAEHFHRAIDRDARLPDGVDLFLVAGDGTRTIARLGADPSSGEISIVDHGDGDGTVLRASALNDQRTEENWTPRVQSTLRYSTVLFLPEKHGQITRGTIFSDNLLYWLLEDPRE